MSARIGLSTFAFPRTIGLPGRMPTASTDPLELVELAVELDVQVVQFADNLPLADRSAGELRGLARRADEAGIRIEIGMRGSSAEAVRRHLELAELFGSEILRWVPAQDAARGSVADHLAVLRPHRRAFQSAGVRLAIENHESLRATELRELVERLGPWAGICLDTANSLGVQESVRDLLASLSELVCNVHVKDVRVERVEDGLGFMVHGCPVGHGDVELAEVLSVAEAADASMIVEHWTPAGPTWEAERERELAWARESVRRLGALTGREAEPPA